MQSKTRRWVLLGIAILALIGMNALGLKTLLGTGPSDKLASVFVFGVGMFWTQFQLLGMLAALAPGSKILRAVIPFSVLLILLGTLTCFIGPFGYIGQNGSEACVIAMTGFLANWILFIAVRSICDLRFHAADAEQENTAKASFGILDLLIVTTVCAVFLALLGNDLNTSTLTTGLISAISYIVLTLLLMPLNLMLSRDRRSIVKKTVWFSLVVLGIPTVAAACLVALFPSVPAEQWPFLYCLILGSEAAWLITFAMARWMGYHFVSKSWKPA
jgi:hypothetical protein